MPGVMLLLLVNPKFMSDFINNLSSIYWWISVVIVGILINLLSAYLKVKLDSSLSRVSSWWRNKSEARKAQRLKDLARLRNDSQEQMKLMLSILRYRITSIMYFLWGVTIIVLAISIDQMTLGKPLRQELPHRIFRMVTLLGPALFIIVASREYMSSLR